MIMNCNEVKINLPEYIDGKLDKTTREKVEIHLESCSDCKAQLKEMSAFLAFMNSVPNPEVPDGMKDEFAICWPDLTFRRRKKYE